MGALRRAAVEGDVKSGSLMAGQSVGLINKSESVQEIIDALAEGTEKELQYVKSLVQ